MKPFGDSENAMHYQKEVKHEYNLIENEFDLVYEKDTYEDTLEMVENTITCGLFRELKME